MVRSLRVWIVVGVGAAVLVAAAAGIGYYVYKKREDSGSARYQLY